MQPTSSTARQGLWARPGGSVSRTGHDGSSCSDLLCVRPLCRSWLPINSTDPLLRREKNIYLTVHSSCTFQAYSLSNVYVIKSHHHADIFSASYTGMHWLFPTCSLKTSDFTLTNPHDQFYISVRFRNKNNNNNKIMKAVHPGILVYSLRFPYQGLGTYAEVWHAPLFTTQPHFPLFLWWDVQKY